MKKIKSYTGIWNVEKVLYAINDFTLPFPVTFTQITWFVITEFAVILLGDLPPLSFIEGAFLKYFGIPVALTWFMSQKTFDGKKPYSFLKSQVTFVILSRLVDTFFSRISLTMPPAPKSHNTACVLPQEEPLHWQSRSSGYSSS